MPDMSSVRTFVNALKTGRTKTTKALEDCDFPSHLDELKKPDVLDKLPTWARDELKQRGLNNAELAHINKWPDGQKESIRVAIVAAIEGGQRLQFFWELDADVNEGTSIRGVGGKGNVIITFLSPRAKVNVSGNASGEITVGVGKPD